MMIYFEVLWI